MSWLHRAVLPFVLMTLSVGAAVAVALGHAVPTEYLVVLSGAWGLFSGKRIGGGCVGGSYANPS